MHKLLFCFGVFSGGGLKMTADSTSPKGCKEIQNIKNLKKKIFFFLIFSQTLNENQTLGTKKRTYGAFI